MRKRHTLRALVAAAIAVALPALAPNQEAEASHGRCTHHTKAWTGCKSGFSLYYTDRFYARLANTRISQGYTTRTEVNRANGHFTAHTDCSRVGDWALLSLNGKPAEWHLILDCSDPTRYRVRGIWTSDTEQHVREGRVAEVGAKSFVENGCAVRLRSYHYLNDGSCPATLLDVRDR
jgi:hypothetical protein